MLLPPSRCHYAEGHDRDSCHLTSGTFWRRAGGHSWHGAFSSSRDGSWLSPGQGLPARSCLVVTTFHLYGRSGYRRIMVQALYNPVGLMK